MINLIIVVAAIFSILLGLWLSDYDTYWKVIKDEKDIEVIWGILSFPHERIARRGILSNREVDEEYFISNIEYSPFHKYYVNDLWIVPRRFNQEIEETLLKFKPFEDGIC